MYVVRRAFRNHGQMITPGSAVEPGNVKRFKSRLNDRYIIEVNEHNFEKWDEYFRVRMNVTIPRVKTDDVKTDEVIKATPVVKVVSK